jgi:hypothetical protein
MTHCKEIKRPKEEIKTKFYIEFDFDNVERLKDVCEELYKIIKEKNPYTYLHNLFYIIQKEVDKIK